VVKSKAVAKKPKKETVNKFTRPGKTDFTKHF
jgi:hypothetical protein